MRDGRSPLALSDCLVWQSDLITLKDIDSLDAFKDTCQKMNDELLLHWQDCMECIEEEKRKEHG